MRAKRLFNIQNRTWFYELQHERQHVAILNIFLMKIINADSFRTILFDYCMNGLDQSYSKVKLVFRQLNRLH